MGHVWGSLQEAKRKRIQLIFKVRVQQAGRIQRQ